MSDTTFQYQPWPSLPYDTFQSTKHLLHMLAQAIGKLKLTTPFEPHFSNVSLLLTAQGLTTGAIPYAQTSFTVDMNLVEHAVKISTSYGKTSQFEIKTGSVAQLIQTLFNSLNEVGINISINPKPQEVANPILFHEDQSVRLYQPKLANDWFRILLSTYAVMLRFHHVFKGITPSIGLMWGTFDLRDVRFLNETLPTEGLGFIRRNSSDAPQFEIGWWSGDERYPQPAFFSFFYPEPKNIANKKVQPAEARWDHQLREFILDYSAILTSSHPEEDLFNFFESCYQSCAEEMGWDTSLIGEGKPL